MLSGHVQAIGLVQGINDIIVLVYNRLHHTVDGKNPAAVDMVNVPVFTGVHTWQVVQDFFHQQYHIMSYYIISHNI